jgi:peptidoglycan-associated lipoprotein
MKPRTNHRPLGLLLTIAGASALAAFGAGCSDPVPPPKTSDDAASTAKPAAKSDRGDPTDTQSAISIDDKIIKLCGDLPTAHFGFDSSEVQSDAANALDALARCFISGPGKGKSILLTGSTDPRGETEYNLALGGRRAGSVADFLEKKGMEKGHLKTNSNGEFGATGTDEAGWAKDRKVEITLAE